MTFIEAPTNFYLGRTFDPQSDQLGDDIVYYDSRDLLTHAVVVGMTGSGKTGLCINLLEEAILDNIPAIIIDPKGDIANLALTFPSLAPEDFAPWIHDDDAQRAQMDKLSYAANVAQRWREGLDNWDIVPERLAWLKGATELNIYTPGSDSGLQISILASLRAPRIAWQGNEEIILERITGTVSALFALGGLSYQPVKDVEHVLLTNILEWNWRQGRDLTLEDIILQIKQPPFEKLGVFPVEQYISEKKRYKLAMEMNNVIASPSFQTWLQGEPLDIQNLLYRPDGKPRVSIFYIAHLNDQERMFIMTLLLENLVSWMRMQRGTPSLRALLYIDELYGYFPPYPSNPPTKGPLMRLLKQARAFGLGLILATQNPGDLDYKGLTNAGTWFIGRLQSKNDRDRVMAGIQSLATVNDAVDTNFEQLLSNIKPRTFIMRNVHKSGSLLVHTRWCMNYLAGPLTRIQIGELMLERKRQRMAQLQQTGGWLQGRTNFQPPPLSTQATPSAPPPFASQGTPSAPPPFPTQATRSAPPPFPSQAMPSAPTMPSGMPSVPPTYPPSAPTMPSGMPSVPQFSAQSAPIPSPAPTQANRLAGGFLQSQPAVTGAIQQYFLPATLPLQQSLMAYAQGTGQNVQPSGQTLLAYKAVLLAQLQVRYQNKTSNVFTSREYAYHVTDLQPQGLLQWERYQAPVVDASAVTTTPFGQAIFQEIPVTLLDAKRLNALRGDLVDMVAHTARLIVGYHPVFKLYSNPDEDPSIFQSTVHQMAREKRDAEYQKLMGQYQQKIERIDDVIRRKQMELDAEQQEIRDRQRESLFTTGEAVLSIFRGQTNYTLSRMSRAGRMTRQTKHDIQESHDVIGQKEQERALLVEEAKQAIKALNDKWALATTQIQEVTVSPLKKDIHVALYGIGWLPHYYVPAQGTVYVIPALGY